MLVSALFLFPGAGCERDRSAQSHTKLTLTIGVAAPNVRQQKPVDGIADIFSSEALVSIGLDGRPQASLAESWEPLSDGPGVRLKLRPKIVFHTGQPADARSVARILSAQVAFFDQVGWSTSGTISDITAASDDEIVIRYRRPDAFVFPDLSIFPIADLKNPRLRTGPFEVTSTNSSVTLSAFDRYSLGRPAIDAIEVRPYQTPRKAWIALMRGEVNALHEVSREAADFVEAESGVRSYPALRPYYVALVFNQRQPVLSRRDVRIALNEAVDRGAVVRDAMRGRGLPADGPIWPYHWAYSSAQHSFAYNPDAARVRLDAAGLTSNRRHSPGQMKSRFRFTCLVPSDDARFERIALVVQRQLFEIGVDMDIEPVPAMEMMGRRVPNGDFDAFLMEMAATRTLSWVYRFWHSPVDKSTPVMRAGYRGADAALDRLRSAQTDDETRLAVSDLQRALFEDPPAVFLVWPRETRAVDARFNVPYLRDRDVLYTLRDWRSAPADTRASR